MFILPLAFKNNKEVYTTITLVCFLAAMWAPGIAAIIAIRFVEKQPVIPTLRLNTLGQWKAILLSGLIWGAWHIPATLFHGHNFPQHPYLGILLLLAGFPLLGAILAWLTLKTRSPWSAALCHGAFYAVAGVVFFFLQPGFDTALAGSPLGLAGWIPMGLLVAGLIWSKQLPVQNCSGGNTL